MPTFAYEAMNSSGQEVKDEIEAASQEEAIAKIRHNGPISDEDQGEAGQEERQEEGARQEIRPARERCRSPSAGCRESSSSASPASFQPFRTPACPSCDLCRFSNSSKSRACSRRSSAASAMKSKAAERFPRRWPSIPRPLTSSTSNMIAAGEAGGVLDLILARLADFMEKAAKLKKKVIGAMIYPAWSSASPSAS